MLPPLEVQMTACLQQLRTGVLPVSELEALFARIRADAPVFAPPGRQVRHLVDISVKLLGETVPHAFCRLARADIEPQFVRFEDPGVILRQLHADHLLVYDHPNRVLRCAFCLEYQYRPEPDLLALWIAKALILGERLGYAVVLVVIYLTPGRYTTFPDRLRVEGGGLANEHHFETIRLWEHTERIRRGELVELAPLLVLCENGDAETVLREERELLRKADLTPQKRADLLGISYILGLRVASEGIVNAVFAEDELAEIKRQGLIGRWIEEAVTAERVAASDRTAQAVQQAVAQAVTEERRRALLVCLAAKFGALPVAVHQRVRHADAATCDAWLDRVTLAGSLAEVLSEA